MHGTLGYLFPRAEKLFHKLQKGDKFTKINLADAYLQMNLDDDSKEFMVVNTPFRLFQYQRLPLGVASAPAIFQCLLEQIITGVDSCGNFFDDINFHE